MCSCLSPLVGGTSVYGLKLAQIRTAKEPALSSTACILVGREDEAEDIDTLPLGVQWTCSGAKAVSEVSDFGHI